MWSVRILSGAQAGQIYDLKRGKNVFGRGGESQMKVQSLGISKEHCEIHVYKEKMMIVDLKSSNGTFVNGVKIQNSLIRVGDKISLFDIILDIIPTPDIRPKNDAASRRVPSVHSERVNNYPIINGASFPQIPTQNAFQGNVAMQMHTLGEENASPEMQVASPMSVQTFEQKVENYVENVLMPGVYKLGILFSFKQVLLGFVICFIFGVTLLSMIPLSIISKEASYSEGVKRAQSVVRALAKLNEQALLTDQFVNLNTQEALREEGIKEAFIIRQDDGTIIAPSEKAGREVKDAFLRVARNESKANFERIDSNTIGASHPIGVYDPATGEPTVKFHAVVIYDISSLNLDDGRILSLFMQTLIISSILGLLLYFLFSRMIEFPIRSLNKQIDQALLEKSDRTEVPFDYPVFQKLVSNVNTLLNRAWTNSDHEKPNQPQQNRDLEYTHLVEMISHPALVVAIDNRIIACNSQFELLAQTTKEATVNHQVQDLTDSALVQNIESLIVRAVQSPYEKHADQIPFSQFECTISCQAFLNTLGEAEYFILTLISLEPS